MTSNFSIERNANSKRVSLVTIAFTALTLSSIVSLSAFTLFVLISIDVAGLTEDVMTELGITIIVGRESFSLSHVMSDDLCFVIFIVSC